MTTSQTMRAILLCTLLSAIPAFVAAETGGLRQMGIGVISSKPDKRLRDYAAMARYIAERLGQFGIKKVKIIVAKDREELIRLVKQGDVDVMLESAVPTIEMEKAGMVPTLLAWRKGVRQYRTLFVTRKDSSIKTLQDLKGKTIALEDQYSTSAFAIPIAELKMNSLRMVPADGKRNDENAVGYTFAGEASNEAYWVIQGKADTAALSDNDWDGLPEKVRAELRIIHQTNPILRYIVSFRSNLSSAIKNETRSILTNMDMDTEGRRALKKASDIKKIELLTDEDLRSLDYVRGLIKLPD